MTRKTITDIKTARLAAITADERARLNETYAAARLTLEFGEKVRDAR